uniref:PCI domain-containing protein n=2 Tax=Triticum urartu TaxID=4572 RepID=A0A8R7P635_TRIUA
MRNLSRCKDEAQRAACQTMIQQITSKAISNGTLLTKNWDTEPLIPLPENLLTMTETSANNSSSLPTSSTPKRRLKSRWEPVPEEKVTEKVEPLAKALMNGYVHNNLKAQNTMGNSWNLGKSLQSPHAPSSKISHRLSKKQKMGSYSSVVQNGNTSSDSDKEKDLTKYYANASALANSPEEKKRREHRSKRFEKSKDSPSKSRNSAVNKDAMARIHTRRPISALVTGSYKDGSSLAVEDMDWDALTVKGTCQEIEKRYLRLTSAPDPSTVRPEHVLEKALSMVETSQKNYLYKCDQLKSIRQDLTVQRIQNELTVKVYETHARLALQAGDLPEFNQCQSQLKRLYREGNNGCYFEFSAYNLLCVMLHSNNKRDLLSSMASLSKEAKQDGAVKHALAVHAAVSSGNYVIFFKLYKQGPNLNSCLMDLYVERMRFEAIKCMSRSYRPTVPVGYVAQVLGFLLDGEDRLEECEIWLKAHGAVLSVDNSGELQIDTKASSSTLFMPEPENAVAHGDASLAVNDFFART